MKKVHKKFAAITMAIALVGSNFVAQPMDVQGAAKKATAIQLNATSKTLYVGQSTTLKVKTVKPWKASKAVTWATSSKKIATVSKKGKVVAKKEGTAKITAVSKSNKKVKAVCKVTVKTKKDGTETPVPVTNEKPVPSAVAAPVNPTAAPMCVTPTENPVATTGVTASAEKPTNTPSMTSTVENPAASPSVSTSTEIPSISAPPIGGDIIHSGAYGNTTWTIDKDGLLEVKGTGDMYSTDNDGYPNWYDYCEEIKSAKIEVTGATNLSHMFYGCSSLATLDLGNFDTSSVTDMYYMFSGCGHLTSLYSQVFFPLK